jgi:hypothetical protein
MVVSGFLFLCLPVVALAKVGAGLKCRWHQLLRRTLVRLKIVAAV